LAIFLSSFSSRCGALHGSASARDPIFFGGGWRLPRWAFLRWVDVARSGWLGDPDVVSLSHGPVIERTRAVLHAFAQARFFRTPSHWLAAHEGQPRDPPE